MSILMHFEFDIFFYHILEYCILFFIIELKFFPSFIIIIKFVYINKKWRMSKSAFHIIIYLKL